LWISLPQVGPHKTLVGPLMQTLKELEQEALAVPTLKRGDHCARMFLSSIGALLEKGVAVNFEPWLADEQYTFLRELPRHPFICKPLHPNQHTYFITSVNGIYQRGPMAGRKAGLVTGHHVVEVSDRTMPLFKDHNFGGVPLMPGMGYVEVSECFSLSSGPWLY
jgi:acyl transferase domain-containing protein